MRKLTISVVLTLVVALPTYAAKGRDQSYITFDDGGTIVKQGDDNREVEGRVNLPVYPGDEVTTSSRGRTEIRLADGNVITLDRSTSIRLQSISNAYEDESSQSIIEVVYGHVGVTRTAETTELLRIDTANASYAAVDQATYAVDVDSRGRERVTVFDGSIEVRTPLRTTRLRRGEEARVDDEGVYGLVNASASVADEFERWFIRRAERYSGHSSRYLDRSLSYSERELDDHGTWVYHSGYNGWGWRPRVSVGWRPYYHGRWGYGRGGHFTWISYEPWGWVPYHYGRWAYDPISGWLWLPGYTYAPAWVYWAFGPSYVGWAPAGWYDCYRPYYSWAYRPYHRAGDFGFGFYGRVRMNEIDLRPWTFVNPNGLTSTRVDQAALTTDAVRQRLLRDGSSGALATVTGTSPRFSRNDLKDPAAAVGTIARRGLTGGAREGGATPADMTPYFRRDPDLAPVVRERIVRSRGGEGGGIVGAPSGVPTPGTPGTLEGQVGTRDGAASRVDTRTGPPGTDRSRIYRDTYHRDASTPSSETPAAPAERGNISRGDTTKTPESDSSGRKWRDRVDRAPAAQPSTERPSTGERTPAPSERTTQENWRGRTVQRGVESGTRTGETPSGESRPSSRGDIPRRIIDRIGGARISPGDTPRETSQPRASAPRETSQPRASAPRESSTPREAPRAERSSPPPQRDSSPKPSKSDGGGGGRIKRD